MEPQRLYIEYLGDSIELPLGETVVGRDVGCALRFNDPSVSRRHLRFVHRLDDVFVEDLGSSNGTLVNGRSITGPIRLCNGDILVVGSRSLTVRSMEGEADDVMPPTLVLDEDTTLREDEPEIALPRRVTTNQFPRIPEPLPANQRCPKCAAPVRESDARCAACNHVWGRAPRAMAATVPPPALIPLERRRHDRVPKELRVIYSSDDLEIEALTTDLSQNGVFVRTQVVEAVGTKCQLTILIDGGPALKVRGIVRRVVEDSETGLGVELVDLGANERAWIDIAVVRITS